MGGDEGSLGSGPCLVAGTGFRLVAKASIEIDLLSVHHQRNIAGGLLEGRATGVLGDLVYHLGQGRTHVFAMGSAGILNSSTTHMFPSSGLVHVVSSHVTDFAWGGGAGVKIFVKRRLSLRPQVRILFSERTGVMGLVATSLAVGYHW
jgi:hypothetical protein